jgi:hypothetical protein
MSSEEAIILEAYKQMLLPFPKVTFIPPDA